MANKAAVDYVKKERKKGFSDKEIFKALLGNGYEKKDVKEIMAAAGEPKKAEVPAPPPGVPGCKCGRIKSGLSKISAIMFKPTEFFNSVEKQTSYWEVLKFYVLVGVVVSLVTSIISVVVSFSANVALSYGLLFILTVVGLFIIPFILTVIYHLGILILGGKQGFYNTFKPATYVMVIGIVYNIVTWLVGVILTLTTSLAIDDILEMSKGGAVEFAAMPGPMQIMSIIASIVGLVSLIHTLIVLVKGVKKFQNMSTGRALIGIILIPIVLGIVVAILGLVIGFSMTMLMP